MSETKATRAAYGEALVKLGHETTRSWCWTRTFPTPR